MILVALATCGCKSVGIGAKREAEKCCPTDIRKTVPWCAGEDALFQCPCEPDATYYGYKPTCWGIWPSSGAAWRDSHCGHVHHGAILTELTNRNPELIPLPQTESYPTPMPEIPSQPLQELDRSNGSLPEPELTEPGLGAAMFNFPALEYPRTAHRACYLEQDSLPHGGTMLR